MAKNDMTALLQFLQSDDYTNGHGNATDLIAAINDMNDNIRVKEALVVLKTALNEEEGWLIKVLQEHKIEAAFVDAWDVCVRIYTSIRFLTGDSEAPRQPTYGEWHYVDLEDTADKLKLQEIQAYCDFRLSCSIYTNFLMSRLNGALEKEHPGTLDKILVLFTSYPRVEQLLALDSNPQSTQMGIRYHTSYFNQVINHPYSRSWLLANVHVVMKQLEIYKNTLFNSFPAISRDRHTRLYDTLLIEYNNWERIAKANFKPPLTWPQHREWKSKMNTVRALLEELKYCHT
jgi:hypothetical protein